jgi:hypothetical protein
MQVDTAGVRDAAAAASRLDTDVTVVRGLLAGAGWPREAGVAGGEETAATYRELQDAWTGAMERLAASLGDLAAAVSAAAADYDRAEATNEAAGVEGGGRGRR